MPDYTAVTVLATGDEISDTEWLKLVNNFALHQEVQTAPIVNSTGGTITRGYVGVLDPASPTHLVAAASGADARRVVVVQSPSLVNGAAGYGQIFGRCGTVSVQGAVAYNDLLETHPTAGYARVGSAQPFGRALSVAAGPGAGAVIALLVPPIEGGSDPTGVVSATHGPVEIHLTGISNQASVIAAPGVGKAIFITRIKSINSNATASLLAVKAADASKTEHYPMAGVVGSGALDVFPDKWELPEDVALDLQQSATADLYVSISFYVGAPTT